MATFLKELKGFLFALTLWEKVVAALLAFGIAAFFRWIWNNAGEIKTYFLYLPLWIQLVIWLVTVVSQRLVKKSV